jgi:hypothetical protein
MKRSTLSVLMLLSTMLILCQKEEPYLHGSDRKRFVAFVADWHRVRTLWPQDSTAQADSSSALLKKHRLTRERIGEIISRMNQKPERWESFYKDVNDRIRALTPGPPSADPR